MILPNGLWVCLYRDFGLLYYDLKTAQWLIFTGFPGAATYYTAEVMRDGLILVSSSKGIHLVKDTSIWIDVTSGLARNDSSDYYRITRFIEDKKNNIYYAATRGAGVWKSAAVLQSTDDEARPLTFTVLPNPFTNRTTINFPATEASWCEIELRN